MSENRVASVGAPGLDREVDPKCAYTYELESGSCTESIQREPQLLKRWRQAACQDNPQEFARKLELEGLTPDDIGRFSVDRMAGRRFRAENDGWLSLRARFCARAAQTDERAARVTDAVLSSIDEDGHASFRGLVRHLLEFSWVQLEVAAPAVKALQDSVVYDLLYSLSARALWVTVPTLVLDLNIKRVSGQLVGQSAQDRYRHYAEELLSKREVVDELFQTYPVLERTLFETLTFWIESLAEFFGRFEIDLATLRSIDAAIGSLSEIKNISMDSSDSHKKGRTVVVCHFDHTAVVYKPRSLKVDCVYTTLLELIDADPGSKQHKKFWTLDRGRYGWQEWVSVDTCSDEMEVKDYYWRLGSLIAVTYALNGSDLHQGNLIASGPFPVIVDLECLLSTPFKDDVLSSDPASSQIEQALARSVSWTGLLPDLVDKKRDGYFDLSAIGGVQDREWPVPVPTLMSLQQDSMHYVMKKQLYGADKNRVLLNGEVVDPALFVDDTMSGFRWTYETLLQHKERLVALIESANDGQVRVIFRGTQYYALLLAAARHPDLMTDALEREMKLDRIWRDAAGRDELALAFVSEKQQLARNDIPYFFAKASSNIVLAEDGRVVCGRLAASPIEYGIRKVRLLSLQDRDLQASLISKALNQLSTSSAETIVGSDFEGPGDIDLGRIEAAAMHVASQLLTETVVVDGDIAWLDVRDASTAGDTLLSATDDSLYAGTAGIALFLCHAEALMGDTSLSGHLELCARRLVAALDMSSEKKEIDWSAFSGKFGAAYALLHIGHRAGFDHLLAFLRQWRLPDVSALDAGDHVDIIAGRAGVIIVLLRLYDCLDRLDCLATAESLGRTLVRRAVCDDSGCSWICPEFGVPLTGFAHGAGGIAYALSELATRCTDSSERQLFREIAEKAIAFEQGTYDPVLGGWPDRRPDKKGAAPGTALATHAWCHGEPGIALAKSLVKQSEINATVGIDWAGHSDCLCHGAAGNFDIAGSLEAHRPRAAAESQTRVLASRLATRVLSATWRSGLVSGVHTPGLMLGLSGIGLALLRACKPDRIPSVLHLEGPLPRRA